VCRARVAFRELLRFVCAGAFLEEASTPVGDGVIQRDWRLCRTIKQRTAISKRRLPAGALHPHHEVRDSAILNQHGQETLDV
jgi:hypothetical protein